MVMCDTYRIINILKILNIDIFIQYRDTILAFGCIDTLEWASLVNQVFLILSKTS